MTNSPAAPPFPSCLPCPNDSPASASLPSRGLKATSTTANRPCCSLHAQRRPPQMALGSSPTTAGDKAIAWSGGSEPAQHGSTLPPSKPCAKSGSTSPWEYPKPWTDESSGPPMSSSPWAAALPDLPRKTLRELGTPGSRRPRPRRRNARSATRHRRTRPPTTGRPERPHHPITPKTPGTHQLWQRHWIVVCLRQ